MLETELQYVLFDQETARDLGLPIVYTKEDGPAAVMGPTYVERGWVTEYQERLQAELNLADREPSFWNKPLEFTLGDKTIFMDLAVNAVRDEVFFSYLEEFRALDLGVVIWLDFTQDVYTGEIESGGGDQGYHYALITPDVSNLQDNPAALAKLVADGFLTYNPTTEDILALAGTVLPLPMLAERLGYVKADVYQVSSGTEHRRRASSEISISFGDLVQVLIDIYGPKVRLGLRSDWDKLYHPHRIEMVPRAWEDVTTALSGPQVPTGPTDEERLAAVQDWLVHLDRDRPSTGMSIYESGVSFLEALLAKQGDGADSGIPL